MIWPVSLNQIKFAQSACIKHLDLRHEKKVKLSRLLKTSIFLCKIPLWGEKTVVACFLNVL